MAEPKPNASPIQRALSLTSRVADKSNDAFLEVAFGLGRSAGWTSRKLGEVTGRLRRLGSRAPRSLEERLRDILMEEARRLKGTTSADEIGKLAARLADLLGRIYRGEASVDDIQAVRAEMIQSRPFAEFMVGQSVNSKSDKLKSEIFRRIFEDNQRLQDEKAAT
jgi:hypothetical protein